VDDVRHDRTVHMLGSVISGNEAPNFANSNFHPLLMAHKKGIQCAAVNSFGYIAKSLGSQDVLSVLLTNLRVQERQSRVCSTVATAIVAETCGPSRVSLLFSVNTGQQSLMCAPVV
jgi:hypothetical protein